MRGYHYCRAEDHRTTNYQWRATTTLQFSNYPTSAPTPSRTDDVLLRKMIYISYRNGTIDSALTTTRTAELVTSTGWSAHARELLTTSSVSIVTNRLTDEQTNECSESTKYHHPKFARKGETLARTNYWQLSPRIRKQIQWTDEQTVSACLYHHQKNLQHWTEAKGHAHRQTSPQNEQEQVRNGRRIVHYFAH